MKKTTSEKNRYIAALAAADERDLVGERNPERPCRDASTHTLGTTPDTNPHLQIIRVMRLLLASAHFVSLFVPPASRVPVVC